MVPTLLPGDRLLVDPESYRGRPPQVGEIVVLADPERQVPWLVKKVVGVDLVARTVDVRGEAAEVARDSRRFGPVPFGALVGRAYRIYHPPERRRTL
jgi:signal peptidase I